MENLVGKKIRLEFYNCLQKVTFSAKIIKTGIHKNQKAVWVKIPERPKQSTWCPHEWKTAKYVIFPYTIATKCLI